MTKEQQIIQTKATALNAIRKIYHPLYKGLTSNMWDEENWAEQRDSKVMQIIEQLEKDLEAFKINNPMVTPLIK